MAGVLLHDGIGRGSPPAIEVLSMGSSVTSRQSSDLLPFVPEFTPFLTALPKTPAEISLKPVKIPLGDVECITKTMVKVRRQFKYIKVEGVTNIG